MNSEETLTLHLRRQVLQSDAQGYNQWEVIRTEQVIPATETALLLCDVWDKHWCRGADERLAVLLPRMNQVVQATRQKGVQIIHAPSDTMDF